MMLVYIIINMLIYNIIQNLNAYYLFFVYHQTSAVNHSYIFDTLNNYRNKFLNKIFKYI